MPLTLDQKYNRPAHSYNLLWSGDDDDGDRALRIYPFVFGVDGMGEIHPEEATGPPNTLAPPQPASAGTPAGQPSSSANTAQQAPSSKPGVVSYALPTPNTPLPPQTGTLSIVASRTVASASTSATVSSVSTSISASLVSMSTLAPVATLIPSSSHMAVVPLLATSTAVAPSLLSPSIPTSQPQTSALTLTSTVFTSPSATEPPHKPKHQHVSAIYVALALGVLIVMGTIFASLSWILRRRRKRQEEAEGEMWIGHVLNDDPDDYLDLKRDENPYDFEKGNEEPIGPGAAGVGANHGGGTYPGSPVLSSRHFRDTPAPPNGPFGMPPHAHGFANVHPSWRHPSVLRRGAPTAIEYPHHGLDGGGLTFRQDPNGGLTFQPASAGAGAGAGHAVTDITTPNPYPATSEEPPYPNPYDDASPRRPAPTLAHSATASHYSYERAGTLAVTNLMPGDISSRASETSLGRTSRLAPPGLENKGPPRSLGLPTGRLDNPNPWRRYDGVENRGGAMGAESAIEESRGWGATIRSGIYSAMGRIVGAPDEEREKDRTEERERDRFTELVRRKRLDREQRADSDGTSSEYEVKVEDHYKPDDDPDGSRVPAGATSRSKSPSELRHEYTTNWRQGFDERRAAPGQNMVPDSRGWIVEEETSDGSRGRIHISSGARDRILHRLASTATGMSSPTTAYSTDVDPVFTSATPTRVNTIATSRRDTISTRWSGCRRRENSSRNGVTRGRERELSSASSDWGTSGMAKTLGMDLGDR